MRESTSVLADESVITRRKSALSQQARDRKNQKPDGNIHAVKHRPKFSRNAEAAAAATVERPPQRTWKRASSVPGVQISGPFRPRWVRVDGRNRGDHQGVENALQEGWEFVKKGDLAGRHSLATKHLDTYGDCIANGDMVLMKMHEDMLAQRNAYYARKRDKVTAAIERDVKENSDSRMPMTRKAKSRTEFLRIRGKPRVSGDVAGDEDD